MFQFHFSDRIFTSGLVLPFYPCVTDSRVIKTAIEKRAGKSENKGHEESLARGLLAPGRLRGEKTAGCGDPASHPEPAAAIHCRNH